MEKNDGVWVSTEAQWRLCGRMSQVLAEIWCMGVPKLAVVLVEVSVVVLQEWWLDMLASMEFANGGSEEVWWFSHERRLLGWTIVV